MQMVMLSIDQASPHSPPYTLEEGTWPADAAHEAAHLPNNIPVDPGSYINQLALDSD